MKVEHAERFDEQDHRALVLWAADCAEHVLPYFEEKYPEDNRPRKAVEAGRAWVRMANGNSRNDLEFLGESGLIPDSPAGSVVTLAQVRAAALAAHAAARDAEQGAARAAARAAGHAAATAHVTGHARHAAAYAVTAATNGAAPTDAPAATAKERDWQCRDLPKQLRSVALLPSEAIAENVRGGPQGTGGTAGRGTQSTHALGGSRIMSQEVAPSVGARAGGGKGPQQ
jgi:hypothetical protein